MRTTLNLYGLTDDKSDRFDVWLNGISAALADCSEHNDWYNSQSGVFRGKAEHISILRFSSDERVHVRCVPKRASVARAVLRPLSGSGKAAFVDGGIEFTLAHPGYYALETDGACGTIHIFFEPLHDFGVQESDGNVLCFGSGVHDIGETRLYDNQTVYIAPDAVVYGSFIAVNVSNIRICGFGILDGSRVEGAECELPYPEEQSQLFDLSKPDEFLDMCGLQMCTSCGIWLFGCKNVRIEGVTLRNCAFSALKCVLCEHVSAEHVKAIGSYDHLHGGISIANSRDCSLNSCFVRSYGDCVLIEGLEGFDSMSCSDIDVHHCVLWNEHGRALMIGICTNADEICDIRVYDCDLINAAQSFIGILSCNRAYIHHIEYKRIRVEYALSYVNQDDTQPPVFADISVFGDSLFGGGDENGTISDVVIAGIHLRTDDTQMTPQIQIQGLDSRHDVKNVYLDGLFVNGMRMTSLSEANIFVNAFASKIVFE